MEVVPSNKNGSQKTEENNMNIIMIKEVATYALIGLTFIFAVVAVAITTINFKEEEAVFEDSDVYTYFYNRIQDRDVRLLQMRILSNATGIRKRHMLIKAIKEQGRIERLSGIPPVWWSRNENRANNDNTVAVHETKGV